MDFSKCDSIRFQPRKKNLKFHILTAISNYSMWKKVSIFYAGLYCVQSTSTTSTALSLSNIVEIILEPIPTGCLYYCGIILGWSTYRP